MLLELKVLFQIKKGFERRRMLHTLIYMVSHPMVSHPIIIFVISHIG